MKVLIEEEMEQWYLSEPEFDDSWSVSNWIDSEMTFRIDLSIHRVSPQ